MKNWNFDSYAEFANCLRTNNLSIEEIKNLYSEYKIVYTESYTKRLEILAALDNLNDELEEINEAWPPDYVDFDHEVYETLGKILILEHEDESIPF